MDLIDKKILCELDINCRTPYSKIAKKLRIGRNVFDYRVKKLEKESVITNYICSINLGKLGYNTYKIYFKIKSSNIDKEKRFINFILEDKRAIHFLKTEGSFDYTIAVAVKDIKELDEFISELRDNFNEIINDYMISIVVFSRIFKLHKLLLKENKEIIKFDKYDNNKDQITLDDKDKVILKTLSNNAKLSIVALSEVTGLSIDIIKYRLKILSSTIISSFRMIPDINKLGFFHYVAMLKIRNSSINEEKNFVNWCANKYNIMYLTKRIGYFDYELNFAIMDIKELNSFISELKLNFNNIIDSYELIINSNLLKLNYLPF